MAVLLENWDIWACPSKPVWYTTHTKGAPDKGKQLTQVFLQSVCVTIHGLSIHLMYQGGILFPSIRWKTEFGGCLVVGCIPDPLLKESISSFGFDII